MEKSYEPLSRLDFDKESFDELLQRRFFLEPAFDIYGGCKGLYDLGPPGLAIKTNIINHWRNHFILEEDMLEIECTALTPERVLKTSGHVDKFTDLMVQDVETKECYRADKLLQESLEKQIYDNPSNEKELKEIVAKVDDLNANQLDEMLKKYNVLSDKGNPLSEPYPFNLMFPTPIGPNGNQLGYLRPETAQGIFVNFDKLLKYNRERMPFAGATIGTAFRNEISPRGGLLRVREFTLAEIEHFVDPSDKSHPKFNSIANVVLPLYPRENQLTDQKVILMSMGEAVKEKIVANETLGYFLVRILLFLQDIGIKNKFLRFRQHLSNEMAHYATDCWDAELLTSHGWIECVGCADRSCYDLNKHQEATGSRLSFFKPYDVPKEVTSIKAKLNKAVIGRVFRKDSPKIIKYLTNVKEIPNQITIEGQDYTITNEMIEFNEVTEKVSGENIVPSVIEPSFGIGRILYALLEQSFYIRSSEDKRVLCLPSIISPIKCAIFPLQGDDKFDPILVQISNQLKAHNIPHAVDKSGAAIGKKYARVDELGVPFAITVDFETLDSGTVTIRERDSTSQKRIQVDQVATSIKSLMSDPSFWTLLN